MATRAVDAAGIGHARATSGARIVSLVPSITELLFALGLDAQIVALTLLGAAPLVAAWIVGIVF